MLRNTLIALASLVFFASHAVATDLAVGSPAPGFSLQGSDGKAYTLAQFKGKEGVVLAWFPKAFTSG